MLKRFYCSNLTEKEVVSLEEREAHHAFSVLRMRPNGRIELFDGRGNRAEAKILKINKKTLEVRREEVVKSEKYPLTIHLAQAVPHRKKLDNIVEKCEELGVSKIILLKSAHTVFDFNQNSFEKMLERFRVHILECAKQSRNNFLMEIEGWQTGHDLIKTFGFYDRVFLMSPGADFVSDPYEKLVVKSNAQMKILILVGPEGGFSAAEERDFGSKGSLPLPLGETVLKCDTAAVASVSLLKFAFERKVFGT